MGQTKPFTPDQTATADYIDDMAAQLADLARMKGLTDRAEALDAYQAALGKSAERESLPR